MSKKFMVDHCYQCYQFLKKRNPDGTFRLICKEKIRTLPSAYTIPRWCPLEAWEEFIDDEDETGRSIRG